MRARRGELRRVLELCRDYDNTDVIPGIIEASISETGYLGEWWQGLWVAAGVPRAKSVARDMRVAKAAGEGAEDYWLQTLRRYATQRAGNNIVIVSGTWKSSLVALSRSLMEEDLKYAVEKLPWRQAGNNTKPNQAILRSSGLFPAWGIPAQATKSWMAWQWTRTSRSRSLGAS